MKILNLEVPGINLQDGLDRIGNSEVSYLRFLHSFQKSLSAYQTTFSELSITTDYAKLRSTSHQLFGASSMVGAEGLAECCDKITATTPYTSRGKLQILLKDLLAEINLVRAGLATLPKQMD